jgi:hypothetical protein
MHLTSPVPRRFTPELLATIVILLGYIVWLISLPAWPSQDGPVHLYYTHVFSELLSHQPTVYAHYYTIKHLLPPYALYYYALLALSKFVPLLLADRLMVCVYLLLFVFGFRFLAQAIGPSADRATLLVMLIALNWSVGIGFLNYCLSLAMVFWAIGIWLRFSRLGLAARFGFLLLVAAITLTHPVPLLILFTFCALDLLRQWILLYKCELSANLPRSFLADIAVFLLSVLALVYVKHFATAHPLSETQSIARSFPARVAHNVLTILQLHNLSLVFGHSVPMLIYRFSQLLTLVIAYAFAIAQRLRNRAQKIWTPGDSWLVISIALLVFLPLLPSEVSDAFYFTERLTILIWLAPLLAVAGQVSSSAPLSRQSARPTSLIPSSAAAVLAFALISNLCLLFEANRILRPIATHMSEIEQTPRTHVGELALILEDSRVGDMGDSGPAWSAYFWAGAHLLRHDDAVLDNSPWLDSAIIPLGATPALPVGAAATGNSASPHALSLKLLSSPNLKIDVLAPVQLVFITQPGRPAPSQLDPLLVSPPGVGRRWTCQMGASWYQFCTAPGAAEPSTQVSTDAQSLSFKQLNKNTVPSKELAAW